MAFELKEGDGSLFKNDRKKTPNHPDYRGEIMVGGQIFWLSAWVKEGKSGKFLSLSVKPKPEKAPEVPTRVNAGVADMDSDLPF